MRAYCIYVYFFANRYDARRRWSNGMIISKVNGAYFDCTIQPRENWIKFLAWYTYKQTLTHASAFFPTVTIGRLKIQKIKLGGQNKNAVVEVVFKEFAQYVTRVRIRNTYRCDYCFGIILFIVVFNNHVSCKLSYTNNTKTKSATIFML